MGIKQQNQITNRLRVELSQKGGLFSYNFTPKFSDYACQTYYWEDKLCFFTLLTLIRDVK